MRMTLTAVAMKDVNAAKRLRDAAFDTQVEARKEAAVFWHLMHMIMVARHVPVIEVGDGIDKETRYARRRVRR